MKTVEELKSYYFDTLSVTLDKLEQERKKVKKRIIATFVPYTIFVGLFVVHAYNSYYDEELLSIILALLLGGYFLIYVLLVKNYTNDFKEQIISPLIKAIDENLNYSKNRHIAKSIFKRADLFSSPDRVSGNDYVSGEISDVSLSFSDIHAEERYTDSKGKTKWRTIFQGLFIVADFNKSFQGKTVVLPDTAQSVFGNLIGNWLQSINFSRDELIKMDNPEFEKEFVVYSTDQIESRYILSPALMTRLLEFKEKTKHPLYISFNENSIHIAIYNNKDLFEPTVFKSLLKFETAMQYIENLHLAIGIVEDLKLHEKLWSKGIDKKQEV